MTDDQIRERIAQLQALSNRLSPTMLTPHAPRLPQDFAGDAAKVAKIIDELDDWGVARRDGYLDEIAKMTDSASSRDRMQKIIRYVCDDAEHYMAK